MIGVVLFGSLGFCPIGLRAASPDLAQIRDKAERSDPDAQNALGNAYSSGTEVKQDYALALAWYRRAVEAGFSPAEFNLGLAYELGRGVPVDERQAFKYYLMSAEQGFGPAQFNIGNMYASGRGVGQDLFEASVWYKQAAEKGITEAQFNLGLAYESGRGVKKDEVQAVRWYQPAADRGFARAQYNLGLLQEEGRGVAKNETAAAALYRAAAEQGFASAQNNYGLMIAEGRGGLGKDPVQAMMWLSLAVQNGAKPAARDFVAQGLTADQVAEAARRVDQWNQAAVKPASSVAASMDNSAVATVTTLHATGQSASLAAVPEAPALGRNERTDLSINNQPPEKTAEEKSAVPPASAAAGPNDFPQKLALLQQKLDEANQALEKSSGSVAGLTAENDRMEKELKIAKSAALLTVTGPDSLPVVRHSLTDLATLRAERTSLREENNRLRQAGAEAAALRLQNEQLVRENGQLTAAVAGNQRDLEQAQAKLVEFQKKPEAAKSAAPVTASGAGNPPR